MRLPTLKDLVKATNTVRFVRYHDGNLWYSCPWLEDMREPTPPGAVRLDVYIFPAKREFEFPVPVSDIGNATFLAEDRAPLFMRYIRKHLELLEEAKKGQVT